MSFPFIIRPLAKPSLMQRILRQRPSKNAIIELNNLLAKSRIKDIEAGHVRKIEIEYQIKFTTTFSRNLEEFYAVYYHYCFRNDDISSKEDNRITHLARLLSLTQIQTNVIKTELGKDLYRDILVKMLKTKQNPAAENERSAQVIKEFDLPRPQIAEMKANVFSEHIAPILQDIISDRRFSLDQEGQLIGLSQRINTPLNIDPKIKKMLQTLRTFWELENLPLPVLDPAIVTQKHELYHFNSMSVVWSETRSARGVQQLKQLYHGVLHITNKRIVFEAPGKTITIKLSVIIKIIQRNNTLEIIKEAGKNPVLEFSKSEESSIIISRLITVSR